MSLVNSPCFGYCINGGLDLPNRYRKFNDHKGTISLDRNSQSSHGLFKYLYSFLKNEGFRRRNLNPSAKIRVEASGGGKVPLPFANLPKPNLPQWAKCVVGLVFSLIRPFVAITGGRFLSFQRDVEGIVQKVEDVAEILDDVAESVEKVADDVGNKLPEGSWLRKTTDLIEEVSKGVSDTAEEAIDIINKFQEVSDDVEEFIEMVTEGQELHEEEDGKGQKNVPAELLTEREEELQQMIETSAAGTIKEEEIGSAETRRIIKS